MSRRLRVYMMDLLAVVPYYTAYLSKSLQQEPIDLTVGSISYYLDASCFSSRGIRLRPGLLNIVGRFRLPRTLRRVLKLLEGLVNIATLAVRFLIAPPDVLHVQFLSMLLWPLPFDLWLTRLARARGAKIVLTVHDLLPHDTGTQHHRVFHSLYHHVDRIICHSDNVRVRLIAEFDVREEIIDVIPHGPFFYDLPAGGKVLPVDLNLEQGSTVVLWQGIIFPYKGIDLLLDAWRLVENSGAKATLLIVGTGSAEIVEQTRSQILQLDLKHARLYPHFVTPEQLVALYRAADIIVYPYRAITTSGALATGLALGKTIVASDLPVFRELLTDRVSALLVNPCDTDALRSALLELIREPALRQELAANVDAMKFGDVSWKQIAEKTVKSYVNARAATPVI